MRSDIDIVNVLRQIGSLGRKTRILEKHDQCSDPWTIQLSYEIGHGTSAFGKFICELIVDGVTALAMAAAPELAGAEVWEDIELQALCTDLAEHIGSRDANIKENGFLISY
jgi:hypothetical protein